ncbi:DUF3606 domain-containing protein [Devosia marina]|uniref:DUF3606 domain-containing protein n=1 Tax=Devosia marina TaxID=2683198 RepID=A0A7X3K2U9_9HYPH|nr:DUF3606 domain-containing protein [Devosia marina]
MVSEARHANNSQDRARVAGQQDHGVRYEANRQNVSKDEVRRAVKDMRNSRDKVDDKLDRES